MTSASEEGLIKKENIEHINEMTNLIWYGIFTNYRNNRMTYTRQEDIDMAMVYISQIVHHADVFDFKSGYIIKYEKK